jgi:hypothetical protein
MGQSYGHTHPASVVSGLFEALTTMAVSVVITHQHHWNIGAQLTKEAQGFPGRMGVSYAWLTIEVAMCPNLVLFGQVFHPDPTQGKTRRFNTYQCCRKPRDLLRKCGHHSLIRGPFADQPQDRHGVTLAVQDSPTMLQNSPVPISSFQAA